MHTVQWQALHAHLRAHHLELVDDERKHRKIVASQPLKRSSIAIESQPLAVIPLPSARAEICNYCFRKGTRTAPLQRCSRCQSAYFCSKHCFQKAWYAHHQFACKPDQPLQANDDDQDGLDEAMLERVLLAVARAKRNITRQQTADELSQCAQLEAFSSLMSHETKQSNELLDRFKRIATKLSQKPHIKSLGVDPTTLLIYLCRFQCNNFGIVDNQLFAIGEGTYPIGSLFNHSCRPNAVALYNGTTQIIRLLEDVDAGEEITLAYIDVANSRRDRAEKLWEKYFFECDCKRCTSTDGFGLIDTLLGEPAKDDAEGDSYRLFIEKTLMQQVEEWSVLAFVKKYPMGIPTPMTPGSILDAPRFAHYMANFMIPTVYYSQRTSKSEIVATPRATYEQLILKAASASLDYPVLQEGDKAFKPYTLETLKTATRCLQDQMMKNCWPQTFRLALGILVQYLVIYPRYHPIITIHILLIAKAGWNALVQLELTGINRKLEKEYEKGTERWIQLAKETISSNFGEHGEHWREIIELEWIFKRDQKLK
ncbi:hypothetical protein Unana1_00656 [Umbelopsis nana]